MKRVVVDTNILVSALQFGGKPKQFLDLAIDGQIDLAISDAIGATADHNPHVSEGRNANTPYGPKMPHRQTLRESSA